MTRTLSVLMILALLAFALLGCATPPILGGSGAAAQGGGADGTTGTVEPVTAYGPVGGATATKLGYQRQETGTQTAPTLAINLQPEAGATAAASYPALSTIVVMPVTVMGNSQRETTLSAEQLEKLARVAEAAGEAARKTIDASGSAVGKAAAKVAEAAAPAAPVEPAK